MTSLRGWYLKRLMIPLISLCLLIVVAIFAILIGEGQQRKSDFLNLVSKTSSLLNLAFDQRNNTLIETSLSNLLIQSKAEGIAICESQKELLSIAGTGICKKNARNPFIFYDEFPIQAAFGKSVVLKNNLFKTYRGIFLLLISTLVFLFSIICISSFTLRKFLEEILAPMTHGLFSANKLAIREFENIRQQNLNMHQVEKEKAVLEALLEKNAQVAHDIRSPLTALNMIARVGLASGQNVEQLLNKSIARINEIANDLKNQNVELLKEQKNNQLEMNQVFDLVECIGQLIIEKKVEFREHGNLQIQFQTQLSSIKILGAKSDFSRVLSNILNNSKEAIGEKAAGIIQVEVIHNEQSAEILIRDNGPGFPEQILSKIGNRGVTLNKSEGSGLGLYHAVKTVKQMTGKIEISNIVGCQGGQVRILLPVYGISFDETKTKNLPTAVLPRG